MDSLARQEATPLSPPLDDSARLAPRPRTIAETGLNQPFLTELLAKHLYQAGVLDQRQLGERMALAWSILEGLVGALRTGAYVEVRGNTEGTAAMRYALTERGHALALEAMMKSGYVGPAPVPLEDYTRVVQAQSVHRCLVTRERMRAAFADLHIRDALLNQLGPAMHSGRPIFLYGPPGTGKTFIGQRLARLLEGAVLIPHALAVGDNVFQFFDPTVHHPVPEERGTGRVRLEEGHDPRFVRCQRPVATTGGELTLDMLELSYEPLTKQYQAPLQLKANNGIYMIDDLGRQRVAPAELLNRWIGPMAENRDFLSFASGRRFPAPFDVILIFSTNLKPLDLADEAFLRRLGYKLRFETLLPPEYEGIWRQVCGERQIPFDPAVLHHALGLYSREQVPLLPCHPRDLLGLITDQCRYHGEPPEATIERLEIAWNSYFVKPT
ncbi:MAG: ATP-binding protein [Chromatiales bacterium]